MTAEQMAIGLAALVAGALLLAFLARATRSRPAIPVRSRPVLSRAEIAFYERLIRVLDRVGGVDVFPQVCMSALVETLPGLDARERMAVRSTFNRKYVDFTVVDAHTRPLLVIELDDSTHDDDKDRRRDAITAAAGIPTLRVRGRSARDERELERLIRTHLSS